MKTRVLIIDDEPDFTFVVKRILEANGHYRVCEENDSKMGVASAKTFDPDIILLDIMMPEPDGSEVAARLRDDPQTCHVPILFLTALVSQAESCDSSFGFDRRHYLPKPVDFANLVQQIEKCCADRRPPPSVSVPASLRIEG